MKFYDIININAVVSDEYYIGSFKIREVNQMQWKQTTSSILHFLLMFLVKLVMLLQKS